MCRRAIKVATEKIRNEQQKQNSLVQSLSESIHSNEMELQSKRQELREKEALEKQKETARDEIVDHEKELKVRSWAPRLFLGSLAHRRRRCRTSKSRFETALLRFASSRLSSRSCVTSSLKPRRLPVDSFRATTRVPSSSS